MNKRKGHSRDIGDEIKALECRNEIADLLVAHHGLPRHIAAVHAERVNNRCLDIRYEMTSFEEIIDAIDYQINKVLRPGENNAAVLSMLTEIKNIAISYANDHEISL